MSSYVNCLGGRCPHMPFFIGGHMSGGGGGGGGGNVLHSTGLTLCLLVSSADNFSNCLDPGQA